MSTKFPYTFPIIFSPTDEPDYFILVDWNDDGDFGDANEDITADVKSIRTFIGKEERFSAPNPSTLEILVKNENGKYSPKNSSGTLYGDLTDGHEVWVYVHKDASYHNIFRGYTDEYIPRGPLQGQEAILRCKGKDIRLRKPEISVGMLTNQQADEIAGTILDQANWPAGDRNLESFATDTISWPWVYKQNAWNAIQEVMADTLGLFYVDQGGTAVYESRHHRMKDPHDSALGTLSGDETPRPWVDYEYSPRYVRNVAEIPYTPRGTATIEDILWEIEDSITLPDGTLIAYGTAYASKWIDAEFYGPAYSITTPAGTTDFLANSESDGSGTDLTPVVTVTVHEDRGQGALLKAVNTSGTPGYFTILQLRGVLMEAEDTQLYTARDSSSVDSRGVRMWRAPGKYTPGDEEAKDFANWIVGEYADVKEDIVVHLKNVNDTVLNRILTTRISDRLHVEYSPHGIDEDYFVEGIRHGIRENFAVHECELMMMPVHANVYWQIGVSELGTETRLAY